MSGCYSPSFKKPSDVLRMRKKRARSETFGGKVSSPVVSVEGVRPFLPGPLLSAQGRAGGAGVKRRNPFANIENTYNSPKKRALSHTVCGIGAPDVKTTAAAGLDGKSLTLHERLNAGTLLTEELLQQQQQQQLQKPAPISGDESLFEEDLFEPVRSEPVLKSPDGRAVSDAGVSEPCLEFPADWSLKTRLLFTSPQSFSWAEQPKAQEEAQGLTAHCRAAYASLPANIQEPRGCAELRCGFQQCLQYWQHPSFSWLSLFPRIGAERKFSGKITPWAQDDNLQQSLMSDWSVSLTSLYNLLKARLCPYFYLCSHQFTVLFRAAGLNGAKSISALLTPTTRGLREAMKAEGIEFTLPLLEDKKKSRDASEVESSRQADGEDPAKSGEAVKSEHSENEVDDDDDDDEDDDDDGFSWLQEMGVQDKIKKPDAISIKLRKEHREVCLDHRPESVVLVEGSNTFTLLNFLVNCKSLVAGAGSQAGFPPTLLAPTAFRGASLHTLKARTVNVKTQIRTGYQDVCSLEVTGPIMPHTVHALTQLLKPAQKGEFSVGLYTHEPTAVLNVPISQTSEPETLEDVVQDLGRCGLQQGTVQQLAVPTTLGRSALRQLHMRGHSYSWRS
ncbi:protein downstream neighbor of son homolog [Triplophysa dalaica]|uniref:protein downstream neighbor of son homolog n=1 Tax=Triplophysa dalaica TaxID=1582913 RepID=UPI0024E02D45|nr:protein downstream neighbor of son homolog [Triplophysa dalaica]